MAGKVLTKCPKCSSRITNKVECKVCGIIFQKYFQAEARKKALAEQAAARASKKGKKAVYILACILLVAASSAAFYFLGRKNAQLNPNSVVVQEQRTNTLPDQKEISAAKPKPIMVQQGEGGSNDKNYIRIARNATVQVRTPWGLGSGFFISENTIVTNKHVVEFSRDEFDKYKERVEQDEEILKVEQGKNNEYKKRLSQMPNGPTRRELAIIIQRREAEIKKWLPRHQLEMKRLQQLEENLNSQDVEVILSDGTKHSVSTVLTSNNHDLALLKVYAVTAPILKPSRDDRMLEEGDTVYTIGSPLGLRDTVTRGVFSGFRKNDKTNEEYLQTDAAINPGNSGGPLIDSHGNVLGVNTMILNNTEGIGFAIPIKTVYQEFATSL